MDKNNIIRPKILIVDDHKNNLIAMTHVLDSLEVDIDTASSGEEALEILLTKTYVLLLLDVQMPGMDGFEVAELLQKNEKTRTIPIIFVTAINKEEKHVYKGYQAGAVDYLFKPVDPYILISKVQTFLDLYNKNHQHILKTMNKLNTLQKELKAKNIELNDLAMHDNLTALSNRRQFEAELNRVLCYSLKNNGKFAVLFIDIDNFKSVNDTYGHTSGDELLKIVAERISSNIRVEDFAARIGGDEFGVILNNIQNDDDVGIIAEKIRTVIREPLKIDKNILHMSISVGIANYPLTGANTADLMRNADIAMYKAKDKGKNNIYFFTKSLQTEYNKRLEIENALRKAVENDELYLVYQPVFDLESNKPIGLETLVRWKHPELGDISPGRFIPIAENTGLIISIGNWIIDHALMDIEKWYDAGYTDIYYTVNLSPKQLQQGDIYQRVESIISKYNFNSDYLILELTETAVMHYREGVKNLLHKFKHLGINVLLDDFGTGYSSLMKLRELPIYALKIDTSFIRDMETEPKDKMIVKAILSIAKNLGFKTIAEGIETKGQLDLLKSMGCSLGQGFYLKRPMIADKISEVFKTSYDK